MAAWLGWGGIFGLTPGFNEVVPRRATPPNGFHRFPVSANAVGTGAGVLGMAKPLAEASC